MSSTSRTARIFLSSTFRDFGEERDLLVRKVFPGLRERLKDRFVELVDVDLRWGITAEQAEALRASGENVTAPPMPSGPIRERDQMQAWLAARRTRMR